MKDQRNENAAPNIRRISVTGTVLLLVLLCAFLLVSLFTTTRLSSQIKLITEHPFSVNGDISDVQTQLAQMRIRTERLQSYNQPDDIEKVRTALGDLYTEMERLIHEIDDLYLGPDEDVEALQESYQAIKEAQKLLLEFAALPDSTGSAVTEYETERLYPLYETFDTNAKRILSFVRGTQQNIFVSAERLGRTTLLWSFAIVIAMTVGLIYFQAVIRKISGRLYDKNRQFEMLADTIDETFLIFDPQEKECEYVSGSSDRVLGLPSGCLQEDWEAMFQYMDEETVQQIRTELSSTTGASREMTVAYRGPKSTEPRWLQLRFYEMRENTGSRYLLTLTDRTEERKAAQNLQDALVSAQNANNAKRNFLSRMSHEIRTPMNAIIGMTTIAAASIADRSRVEDCLEKISFSSKHLLSLINDVLDMSRIESDRMKLSIEPFELYQFLNNFVSIVYSQASQKGLEFTEKTVGFDEHTTYLGDSLRLNQILLNLISNAVKFTPSGGNVSLEVRLLPSRSQKVWIRFTVSDTGIGMDAAALKHLYEPFEQADPTIARRYGGTGLGMSITLNLVSLMGGHIDVKSQPEVGTTFTVELPFEQSSSELSPVREEALEALKVLVADDERDICEHTALLLERMKIHAEWVLSGTEAVDRVSAAAEASDGFDVCFIDWKMPDMNGIETTRRIREKVGWNTPIIIISAYDWTDIEEEARRAGVNAFIAKPLFQSSLYNALVNVTSGVFGKPKTTDAAPSYSLQGKRLLLAEDNVLNMEIAATLLEMNGAKVEGAENGKIAVERFLDSDPGYFDAILMDVQMPVMDGCEAARQIRGCGRADAGTIPIIATTANAFAEDISIVLAAGMNAHISKPLDIEKLCSVLLEFCK